MLISTTIAEANIIYSMHSVKRPKINFNNSSIYLYMFVDKTPIKIYKCIIETITPIGIKIKHNIKHQQKNPAM